MPNIKSIRHTSPLAFRYLVTYAMTSDYTQEPETHLNYYHNLYSTSMEGIIREMETVDLNRSSKAKTRAYHEIVSFSPDDPVTTEDLFRIAEKYIAVRGAAGAAVLASLHQDTPHKHLHFVISGVEMDSSKALWMNNKDYRQIRVDLERWIATEMPHIRHSYVYAPELVQRRMKELERTNRLTTKDEHQQHVLDCLTRASDVQDLEQLVSKHPEMSMYYRGGKPYGITVDGKNIRWRKLGVKMAFDEFYLHREQDLVQERVERLREAYERKYERGGRERER